MCVGVVGFALEHDGRFVPTAAGHVAGFTATNDLRQVLLTAEQHFDVFMQAAASIEAGVDDDAFAVIVFAENVRINGTETVVAH